MFLLTLAACVAFPVVHPGQREAAPPNVVRMRVTADLRGDGTSQTVRLDTTKAPPVVVQDRDRPVPVSIKRRWRPWRIAAPDIDGDGRHEIVVALYKTTRYIPKSHNCLFVYRYDGREVYPKWLGSTLGRPFTDFAFGRVGAAPGEALVTLDVWMDGRRGVTVHRWTGFGFRKLASFGTWKTARLIGIGGGKVIVVGDGVQREWQGEGKR